MNFDDIPPIPPVPTTTPTMPPPATPPPTTPPPATPPAATPPPATPPPATPPAATPPPTTPPPAAPPPAAPTPLPMSAQMALAAAASQQGVAGQGIPAQGSGGIGGLLSVKGMTMTERMKQLGFNPWLITLGIYAVWHITITALAFFNNTGIGATCSWSFTTDCSNPWQIWWTEYRIFAEVIWCVPFIAMLYFNPKILQKCRTIVEGLDITPAEKLEAAAAIPSSKVRKFVFWSYALVFFTFGTVTHYDVLSFGVFGLLVLWPVYLIQAVLIADTFSMYNTLFILLKNRKKVIIEPFHKNGSAGLDHLADSLTSIAVIPGIFTTVLMIRSGFFVILQVGEASGIRIWGEVLFGAGLLGIALLISMGPLYAIAGPVRERKKDLINQLSERCGFQGLNLEAMLDADINDRKVADMLLMERIQAIEPVDMKAVALIVRRFAVPAFLLLGRTLVGV